MTARRLAWVAALLAVVLPPLGRHLVATLPRLVLIEMPTLLVPGVLAAHALPRRTRRWNPGGATGLTFLAGTLCFWMVPRALDLVATVPLVAALQQTSLLAAGLLAGMSAPELSFVARGATAVYAVAMLFVVGLVDTSYPSLLCGSFNLADQRFVGRVLLALTPVALVVAVVLTARGLSHEHVAKAPG